MADAVLTATLRDEISRGVADIQAALGNIGGVAQTAFSFATGGVILNGVSAIAERLSGLGGDVLGFAGDAAQAQKDLQAQLGLTGDQADKLGGIAETVFKHAWGDSLGDAAAMVGEARRQLGDLSDTDLTKVTEGAAAISDTFEGADYNKVINSVKAIRENFPGATEAQALDLITKGFQNGLDSSGDFLDSIGEYANQFGSGGASVQQFFGLFQSGLGSGVIGTDKIGDAFKEFNVRIQDGSKTTADALDKLHLTGLLEDLNTGKITGADAMKQIVDALGTVDEATRRQTGVALLGTQFEDLGFDLNAFKGIAGTAFSDVAGAVDSLNVRYTDFGSFSEGLWRRAVVALSPLSEGLLGIANNAMPTVEAGFSWFESQLPGVIDTVTGAVQHFTSVFQDGGIGAVAADIGAGLAEVGPQIANQVGQWGQQLISWVAPSIPPLLGELQNLAGQAVAWVGSQAPVFLAQLQSWGQQFISWVGPMVGPALAQLQAFGGQILGWVGEQAAPLLAQLQVWAVQFGGWVGPAVTQFLQEWPAILSALLGQVAATVGPLLAQLGTWAIQFVAWVGPMIPPMMAALGQAGAALLIFVAETAAVLIAEIVGKWAPAMLTWIGTEVLPRLPGALKTIVDAITGWVGGVVGTLGQAVGEIGKAIVDGIRNGISGAWGSFMSWIHEQVMQIPEPIRKALGISSPSRVMAEQIGIPIIDGLISGMESQMPAAMEVMQRLGKDVRDQARRIVDQVQGIARDLRLSALGGTVSLAEEQLDALQDVAAFRDRDELRDVQNDIAKAEAQLQALRSGTQTEDTAKKQQDILAQLRDLTAQEELLKQRGLVADYAQGQIQQALQEVQGLAQTDPEAAAKIFEQQKDYILQAAEYQARLQEALARGDVETARDIQQQIDQAAAIQQAEIALLKEQLANRADDRAKEIASIQDAATIRIPPELQIMLDGFTGVFGAGVQQLTSLFGSIAALPGAPAAGFATAGLSSFAAPAFTGAVATNPAVVVHINNPAPGVDGQELKRMAREGAEEAIQHYDQVVSRRAGRNGR